MAVKPSTIQASFIILANFKCVECVCELAIEIEIIERRTHLEKLGVCQLYVLV